MRYCNRSDISTAVFFSFSSIRHTDYGLIVFAQKHNNYCYYYRLRHRTAKLWENKINEMKKEKRNRRSSAKCFTFLFVTISIHMSAHSHTHTHGNTDHGAELEKRSQWIQDWSYYYQKNLMRVRFVCIGWQQCCIRIFVWRLAAPGQIEFYQHRWTL